jgi:hypothetical protein
VAIGLTKATEIKGGKASHSFKKAYISLKNVFKKLWDALENAPISKQKPLFLWKYLQNDSLCL